MKLDTCSGTWGARPPPPPPRPPRLRRHVMRRTVERRTTADRQTKFETLTIPTLLLRVDTGRRADRTTPDDMLYPIFLRVFPSKLDAEPDPRSAGGGASAQRHARAWRTKVQQKRPTESGRPGNRAPQAASAASARAPHGSRTAPPQLPRDPATSVLHAFTHQSRAPSTR